VIQTYVRLGLGIGIVAEMAVEQSQMKGLVTRPLGQLLGKNVARIAFKKGAYLRNFVYEFAHMLSERLTPALIERAMTGHVADYEL
jgi:LysR family cys regulon transcriptional activator